MKRKIGKILVVVGFFLLIMAGWVFIDYQNEERSQKEEAVSALEILDDIEAEQKDGAALPVKDIDGKEYFGVIMIPDMGVELPVLTECTEWSLQYGPGVFNGDVYTRNLVIGGHNSKAQFMGIDSLPIGSEVWFYDFNGNLWKYEALSYEVLAPNQVQELCESNYDLSLFNCTWDNTGRFVLRCNQITN